MTALIALVGTLLVSAYAVVAGLQILLWNPQAAVPGMALDEIWRVTIESQGGLDRVTVPVLLGIGPALAIALLVCSMIWLRRRPIAVATGYLALLAVGAVGYWFASFSPGMNLADAFGIGGADHAPWAGPLYAVSLVSVLALAALAVGTMMQAPREQIHSRD